MRLHLWLTVSPILTCPTRLVAQAIVQVNGFQNGLQILQTPQTYRKSLLASAQNIGSSRTQNRAFSAVAFEFLYMMCSHPKSSLGQTQLGRGGEEAGKKLTNYSFKRSVTLRVYDRWLPPGDCAERSRTSLHQNLMRRADTTYLPHFFPRHPNAVHSAGARHSRADVTGSFHTGSILASKLHHRHMAVLFFTFSFITPYATVSHLAPLS